MKKRIQPVITDRKKSVSIVMMLLVFFAFAGMSYAQVQPYQLSGTAGYVDTTAYDTVSVPYVKGAQVNGFITNEDVTNDLVVYFAKRDSVARDPNSYVKIGPGKRLKFSFQGRKIFRKASADSVYSQVVFGDGMDLGSGGSVKQSVGTATTSSGTGTLNSTYGIVTTDNMAGNTDATLVINNSYVTEASLILYSVQYVDPVDVATDKVLSHGIVLKQAGRFDIKVAREQAFIGEVIIHFQIIN